MISTLLIINIHNDDWINLVFILILLLLSINKYLSEKRFTTLLTILYSKKYISFYLKDSPLITNTFNVIFSFINVLTVSTTIYFILRNYLSTSNINSDAFLTILFIVSVYYISMFLISYFIDFIILTTEKSVQFSFVKLSVRNFFSIILLPILIIHQYFWANISDSTTILISIYLLSTGIQYVYSTIVILKQRQYSIFHIILYLCTLKFMPSIIFIKGLFVLYDYNIISL